MIFITISLTAIRPRYDRSTTCVTTVGLPTRMCVGSCTAT